MNFGEDKVDHNSGTTLSILPQKKVRIRIELESVVSEAEHHPVIYNVEINTQTYRKPIKHLILYLKTLNLIKRVLTRHFNYWKTSPRYIEFAKLNVLSVMFCQNSSLAFSAFLSTTLPFVWKTFILVEVAIRWKHKRRFIILKRYFEIIYIFQV